MWGLQKAASRLSVKSELHSPFTYSLTLVKRLLPLLLLLSPVLSSSSSSPPPINYLFIREIIELYKDKQYDIVKQKLVNQGFILDKAEPDYTLKGKRHEGVFSMKHEQESPSAFRRQMASKEESTWDFSTEIEGSYSKSEINFLLPGHSAKQGYAEFIDLWERIGIQEDHNGCSAKQECSRFWGEVGGAPNGFRDYVRLFYGLNDYSTTEMDGQVTPSFAFYGSLTYTRAKQAKQVGSPTRANHTKHK